MQTSTSHFFNMRFVSLWLLMLLGVSLKAQDEAPVSSPSSTFGIGQFQVSEDLSSGVLNINLPIDSHILPITLGYRTSGIRVSQRSGVVGLGWNLSVGGAITRQKRGMADDHEQGYSGEFKRGLHITSSPAETNYHHLIGEMGASGTVAWDTEPDVYQFSFMGQGGTFTMDYNRNVVKLSPNLLKIEPEYDQITEKYDGFKITDSSGNQYFFDDTEDIKTSVDGTEVETYTYKWHLTRVLYYQTGKEIELTYSNSPSYEETTAFRVRRIVDPNSGFANAGDLVSSEDKDVENDYLTPRRLDEISFENMKVVFNYGARTDDPDREKLESISYWVNAEEFLNYDFHYKYLGPSNPEKRLMLAGVSKSGLNVYLFQCEYYGEGANEKTLPFHTSYIQDHWGFYNNNYIYTLFPEQGAVRTPSLAHAQANSLKRLYDAQGGYDEYEYELNTYYKDGSNVNAGGLRIKTTKKKDVDGANYLTKSYDYNVPGTSNSSGELYAEPDYDFLFKDQDIVIEPIIEHREHSMEGLTDMDGRHIIYEYVTVSPLSGGKIINKFKTFADEQSFLGTGNYPSKVLKGWNRQENEFEGTQLVTSSMNGPFGYPDFHGTFVGSIDEIEIRDDQDNLLSKEVHFYQKKTSSNTAKGFNFLRQAYRFYFSGGITKKQIDEYTTAVYTLGDGYILPSEVQTTVYDKNDVTKSRTTISKSYYDTDHPLLTSQESYLQGYESKKKKFETDYLFRESGPPTAVGLNNLLALVKENRSYIGANEAGKTNRTFQTINSGQLAVYAEYGYINQELSRSQSFIYNSQGFLEKATDNLSGFSNYTVYDGFGRAAANFSNGSINIAFHSFETDSDSGWSPITLKAPGEAGANQVDGFLDVYAYELDKGSITKTLNAGNYKVSFWKKNGSVYISGVGTSTLSRTYTLDGWTFQAYDISLTSSGTITVAGNADIDHLAIHPEDARMATSIYHPVFGVTGQMDASYDLIINEYDAIGRNVLMKDDEGDVLQTASYHIANYIEPSISAYTTSHLPNSKSVYVTSNTGWTHVETSSWFSVQRIHNQSSDELVISVDHNTSASQRSGTVDLKIGNDVVGTITVTQVGAPPVYLYGSPTTLDLTTTQFGTIAISSNTVWTASVTAGSQWISIDSGDESGVGHGSIGITVSSSNNGSSNVSYGTVEVTGGGVIRNFTIAYHAN